MWMTKKALESKKFSPDAPKWRRVTGGTNIEGVCDNVRCVAYTDSDCKVESKKKLVICNIGYGDYDFTRNSHDIKCPLCANPITPVTCGFTNCQFWFNGEYRENRKKPLEQVNQQERKIAPQDRYERYNPFQNNVIWFKLLIHTRRLDNEKAGCGICKFSISEDKKVVIKGCNHFYHRKCLEDIKGIEKNCVLCRS